MFVMLGGNEELLWTHFDTITVIYGLVIVIGLPLILVREKDKMVASFVKRPRWSALMIFIFPPVWFWMVLVADVSNNNKSTLLTEEK